MSNELYYMAAYFLWYSFLGWCLEVAYHAVCLGKITNRGFLNGPLCPIYGFGLLAVLNILGPFSNSLILLYLGGVILASCIELFGGWALLRLFHMRWWDYTEEPFNLGGYICLKFSLAWGICTVFVLKIIHPVIRLNVKIMDGLWGHILLALLYVYLIADLINTVITVLDLNRDLKRVNAIAGELRKVSDKLTERIGNQSLEANAMIQEQRVQSTLGRYELEDELDRIKKKLTKHRHVGYGRLILAFPQLRHSKYQEELKELILHYLRE